MNILGLVIVLVVLIVLLGLMFPELFGYYIAIFKKLILPIVAIGYLIFLLSDFLGSPMTEHYFANNYTLAVNTVKKCKTLDTMSEKKQIECKNAKSVVEQMILCRKKQSAILKIFLQI